MKNGLFKKSLSVFLSVLMILSCWVWVPGEHNHASAVGEPDVTASLNMEYINQLNTNIDTTMPTTMGKFKDPDMEGDENGTYNTATYGANHYKNIFYSPTVDQNGYAVRMNKDDIPNIDSVRVYYPDTVMLYDGLTEPQMGVVACLDASKGNHIRALSVYMSANANGLVLTDHWKGHTTGNLAHLINIENGSYMFSNDGTEHNSYKINTKSTGEWYFYASDIRFDGSLAADEFVRQIVPTWGFYGARSYKSGLSWKYDTINNFTKTASKTIYVMNVKAYRELISEIGTYKTNISNAAGTYTPESVKAYVDAAKAIINLNPKNVSQSPSAVSTWGSDMSSAYKNYVTARNNLARRNFELTYENLFSFSDWAYSKSAIAENGSNVTDVTTDISAGKITVTTGSTGVYDEGYTSANADGFYKVLVQGGTSYSVSWDYDSSVGTSVWAFIYPVGATQYTDHHNVQSGTGKGSASYTFSTPGTTSDKYYVTFRMNVFGKNQTTIFSNIRFYETSRQDIVDYAKVQGISRVVYDYNDYISTNSIPTITKTGYTLNDWLVKDVDNNGDGKWDSVYDYDAGAYQMAASFVIYSDWTENSYNIAFNANGGSGSTAGISNVLYSADTKLTANGFSRTGYTFTGWNTKADGTGTAIADGATVSKLTATNGATVTLYAQWSMNKHTIAFEKIDGTTTSTQYNYGTVASAITKPANTATKDNGDNHTVYSWPEINDVTGNYTYKEFGTTSEHNYGDWVITVYSNCENEGAKYRLCQTCGHREYAAVEKTAHTPVHVDAKPATCTASGTIEYWYCSGCSKMFSDAECTNEITSVVDPVKGHTEVTIAGKAATCTSTGLTEGKQCSVCGVVTVAQTEIPMLAHTEVTIPAVESTCTATGLTEGKKCSVCGTILVAQQDTELAPHTEEIIPAKESTCTETGLTAGKKCSVCGQILVAQTTTDKKAHSMGEWSQTKAPTCIAEGQKTRNCSKCTYIETEVVPATGVHVYGDWEYTNGSTQHTGTCTADSNCNATTEQNHNFVEDRQPKEGSTAMHDYKCSVCNARGANVGGTHREGLGEDCYVNPIYKKIEGNNSYHTMICECGRTKDDAHDTEVLSVIKAPTCTEKGSQQEKCKICEYTFTRELPANGHTFTETAANDATCTADGNSAYKQCETCNLYFAEDADNYATNGAQTNASYVIGKLGHKFTEIEAKPATCTANGNEAYNYCETCKLYFAENAEKYAANGAQDKSAYIIESKGHTPAEAVKENIVQATCDADGSYNEVVYCSVETCKAKISTTPKTITKRNHDMDDWYYASEADKPTYNKTGTQTRACKNTEESELYAACNHTETQPVAKLVDSNAPTGKIGYAEIFWAEFLENITFGIYVSDSVELEIIAVDAESGVAKSEYYISDEALTEEAVKALADTAWTAYTDKVKIEKNEAEKLVAYAKITDNQGNVTYLSTDGAVFDNTDPVIASDIGCTSATITITEANIQSVTVNGAAVTLTDGEYTVNVVGEHKVVVTDKVGNVTEETVEVKGHSYTTEVTDPTCTAQGYTTYTCTACGDTYTDNKVDALGHKWTDATCTAPKTCSVCDATEGEALGHTWVDATCTAPKTCSACGATEGKALGHTWVDATCTTPKTCSACGATEGEALGHTWDDATCTAAKTCSVCGATEGEALGHTWDDATCTAAKTCSVCGATEGEALGHTWVDATCTAAKTCSVCGATEGEALGHTWDDATCTTAKTCSTCGETEGEALGHSYTYTAAADGKHTVGCANCNYSASEDCEDAATDTDCNCDKCEAFVAHTPGDEATCLTAQICTVCGAELEAALDHDFGTWTTTTPATCKAEGEERRDCSRCDAYETNVLAKTAHTEVTEEYVAPTCVSEGHKGRTVCSVCSEVISEGESLPKTDHQFGTTPVQVISATCTSGKVSIYKCKFCPATNKVVEEKEDGTPINPAPHTVVEVERVEPTCDTVGYYSTFCTVCGTQVETEIIPATGHSDENNDGVCDNCGGKYYNGNNGNGVCGCICHKEGVFMRFIYKIIRFFWKLLGIGKSCSCGAVHY